MLGTLDTAPALQRPDLLAAPVAGALADLALPEVLVAAIDPSLADTEAFCAHYQVGLEMSANCVLVLGRRGETSRWAAAMVLATTRVDVNTTVRKHLDARRASFAPMDLAVAASGMEYGGITPIGLPTDWPILVDPAVMATPYVVVGSGVRRSKLVLPGSALATLPGARVVPGLAQPRTP